jgi:protein TonB
MQKEVVMVAYEGTVGSYIPGLGTPPRGKPSKALVAALVVVSAAHAGLFAYLAYQKFIRRSRRNTRRSADDASRSSREAPAARAGAGQAQARSIQPDRSAHAHATTQTQVDAAGRAKLEPTKIKGSGPPTFTLDPPSEPAIRPRRPSPRWSPVPTG